MPASSSFQRAKINLKPPTAGSRDIRTLPELVDYNAKHNPDHLFCLQAQKKGRDRPLEFLSITHSQLKNAIRQCSAWISKNLPISVLQSIGDGPRSKAKPVALFMESDAGLVLHLLSFLSLGVPIMLLSTRLSTTAINHLLLETSAGAIIASPRLRSIAKQALAEFPEGEIESRPTLYTQAAYEDFITADGGVDTAPIALPGHYLDDLDRNVLILHSSGTTGLPKPLYSSHRFLLAFPSAHEFEDEESVRGLFVSTLPLFHGYGLVAPFLSLGIGKPFCLPASGIIPTGISTVELLEDTNAVALMTVPSTLEEISLLDDRRGVSALLPLEFVAFGGGPLKPSVGESLERAGVKLLNHYGATEVGPLAPIFIPTLGYDWRYFRLRKDMGLEIIPAGLSDHGIEEYRLVTRPFSWTTSFELQDHLITDPKNHGISFTAVGRKDDLIVLATGEKVIAHILESMLSDSKPVKVAVAFGENQFELGVIVEPAMPIKPEDIEHFKSIIWPIVQEASDKMDNHARISSMDAIIVALPDKPIPRSDKGSVMRREAYRVFDSEIAKVYQDLEKNIADISVPALREDYLEEDLKDMIQVHLNWRLGPEDWTADDDLFELGMDSLQAIRLRRLLLGMARKSTNLSLEDRITSEFVYQYPSVSEMAHELKSSPKTNGYTNGNAVKQDEVEAFQVMYGVDSLSFQNLKFGKGAVVLLTSSTGSLGTYLLASLAANPKISKIVCLNRAYVDSGVTQSPRERQKKSCEAKGVVLSPDSWSKIEVYGTNTASPWLGLDEADYSRLRGEVTHILHNAWPVDFKRRLPSFKSQFQAVNNLLNLARDIHATRPIIRTRFLFISSIAVVGQYSSVHGSRIVPEIPMRDTKCTNEFGYGKAKLVCERIIEDAAKTFATEIEATSVRLGQISGSIESGFWSHNEHIPSLIKSSLRVGALPYIPGTLSWLPVNKAADVISEIILVPHPYDSVYHVENPNRQSWYDMLLILRSELGLDDSELLPMSEWVRAVDDVHEQKPGDNPAGKLLTFFREDFPRMAGGDIVLGTDRSRAVSQNLRDLDVVCKKDVAGYVEFWKRSGFLS